MELATQNESPEEMLDEFNNASSPFRITKLMDTRSAFISKAKKDLAAAQEKQRNTTIVYVYKNAYPAAFQA